MKKMYEMAATVKIPEEAQRAIEHRTGYPQGLLKKTAEKMAEVSPDLH